MGSAARDPNLDFEDMDAAGHYWKNKIEQCVERCDLSGILKEHDLNHPANEFGATRIISGDNYTDLKTFCYRTGLKVPHLLQFAWHKVLAVYGNGNETILASKIGQLPLTPAILNLQSIENTDSIQAIELIEMELKKNCAVPHLEKIIPQQFDSLFVYAEDSEITEIPTNFKLILTVRETVGTLLNLGVSFNGRLVKPLILIDLLAVIHTVIESIIQNPTAPISTLDCVPVYQKEIMAKCNETTADFPATKRLHHLFEEAAARTPFKIAVVCKDIELTYQDLNCKANQLANYIHSTVRAIPEQFIALFLDKSELTIITCLGIWKSGAAYVPIDPTYPDERVKFILADCQAQLAITNEKHATRLRSLFLEQHHQGIIEIEPLLEQLKHSKEVNNLDLNLTSSQLAYVTYTSGTTGVPKGVFKEHKGVVNSITDLSAKYGMITDQPEVVVLFAAYVFEPFIRQTLMALINSHKLVIVNDDEKLDQLKFPAFLRKHGVTYLNGTASVLQEYDLRNCPSLCKLVLVGEEFTETRYKKLRETFSGRIITEYGFTESALVTAMKIFEPNTPRTDRTIGKPLRNVKCYVLNKHLKQVPVGAIGELFIGGMGISRGYLNRDELTKERFLENPFQSESEKREGINSKIYKTGDLARWVASGEVEYIGRNDFQIKLRGIRIEPGEIESLVLKYTGVQKCVVLVKSSSSDENMKLLVGYFVCNDADPVSETELLKYLEAKLPRYMVPSRMVRVPLIPVNINGKVDHRALPDIPAVSSEEDEVEPRNNLDSQLCQIWSSILGIPLKRLGIQADFFRLGGHSISCIQLIARIRQELHLSVNLDMIFTLRTIENLSDCLAMQRNVLPLTEPKLNQHSIIGSSYLANSLQQGLIYHHLKQGNIDDAYIMQSVDEYNTNINVEHMREAWNFVQKKYPALRLRFYWQKDGGLQCVNKNQALDWRFLDLSQQESSQFQLSLTEIMELDRTAGFCLESGRLFRVYLIKEADSKFLLLFSYHHIIMDGWSVPILLQNVHQTYFCLLQNTPLSITEETAYLDAQAYLQLHRQDNVEFWTKQIEQVEARCDLSGLVKETKRSTVQLNNYDRVQEAQEKTLTVSSEVMKSLKELIAQHGITMHSILQFVWHKVLQVYGNGSHSIVGTTVSGRNLPIDHIETSVGLFINTLPLIVDHEIQDGNYTVLQAIRDIQGKVNEMNCRSNVELGRLKNGELKHNLFDTIFVLENYPNLDSDRVEELNKSLGFKHKHDVEKLDYPLAVIARESGESSLTLTLCYAAELFEESTINELLNLVMTLLNQVHSKLDQPVTQLELLTTSQQLMLESWSGKKADFPMDKTLHEIFEECVEKFSDKLAVVYENHRLTYSQLNQQANQLAHHIRSIIDMKPDTFIALLMEKSHLMIVSIFGVWKAGGAYVPIDPSYPTERIQFMLEDTQAQGVITSNMEFTVGLQIRNVIETRNFELICETLPISNPTVITSSTDLAYVIYTSGTTGKPKGVMIEHRGVVNLQKSLAKTFGLNESDDEVLLSFSNYVFDHFVEQMTDALLNGQSLVVLNDEMRTDKARLYGYIKENKVTYLSGTPSVLSMYEYTGLDSLRRIDAVGEDFSEPLFKKIRATFSGLIINGYGPTEVSITTHKRLYSDPTERRLNKSIGFPVENIWIYVLNKHMKQVPVGALGELCLGGIGVGRGYLNRPDLTDKQFLSDPFREGRIYKTGDLARLLPNGELECLGRNDFQVKVRGLRIELSEIETTICAQPDVTHSVVIARNDAKKYLIGYYVSPRSIPELEMKKWVQSKLPQYMVPNRLVQISEIPVTINGKVDTRALAGIELSKCTNNFNNIQVQMSEIELKLVAMWSELLQIPEDLIHPQDDFFGLGGDSLMAMTLSFMLTNAFGRSVSVAQVFKLKTIEALCQYISNAALKLDAITPVSGKQPVSLAQERLLFIDELENGTSAFNIPLVLKMAATVNKKNLVQAIESVIERHEALRTLIQDQMQIVLSLGEAVNNFAVECVTVSDAKELDESLCVMSKHTFNLNQELPFKIRIFDVEADTTHFYVSFVFHHICFDGWSWRVFQSDLKAFYKHYETGEPLSLPPIEIQYKDFAAWQRTQLQQHQLRPLLDYWLTKLQGYEPLNLITDYPRPRNFNYTGCELKFELESDITLRLRELTRKLKVSLYSVLVAAYSVMLSTYTNQRQIVIGSPCSNRNRAELENIVGFFVNMLVLKIDVDEESSLENYIQAVSTEVMKSQMHQELPFDKLVTEMGCESDLSRHPIFQVIFTLDQFSSHDSFSEHYAPNNFGETTVKYDLSVAMTQTNENSLTGTFTYAKTLFRPETVTGFLSTYKHILSEFSKLAQAGNSDSKLLDISRVEVASSPGNLIGSEMKDNWTEGRTLHEIFQSIAEQSPDAIALVSESVELTYRELNGKSNQLAHHLHNALTDLRPNDLIALCLDKSELTIISILGVWKAGAAYVPIDPSYPDERIALILQETQAKAIITNRCYAKRLQNIEKYAPVISIDCSNTMEELNHYPTDNMKTKSDESSLCYVIYTSGTTGRPKGVMIQHGGLVNFRQGLKSLYPDQEQAILLLSNYVFDFSIEQIILSILNSNKLLVPPSEICLDDEFYSYLNKNGITYLSGTPTFIQEMDLSKLKHLQRVTVAGEHFTKAHYQKIRAEFSGPISNAYGVTETSVYNMVHVFQNGDEYKNCLGKMMHNMKGYVLNEQRQPLPTGAVGELYLAGSGVARGYLKQLELTAERFLESSDHGRMYRTGDLVRCLHDGTLEYLGRNDRQTKIRGLRVDLCEIEAVLGAHPAIRRCTVLAKENKLTGYYHSTRPVLEAEVLKYMEQKLPSYMIPNKLVQVNGKLEMTVNGKMDVTALEKIETRNGYSNHFKPQNFMESQICKIWSDVLGIKHLGIDDDFFRIGGDSILSMQVARRIRTELKVRITVKDIFVHRTVRKIVSNLLNCDSDSVTVNNNNIEIKIQATNAEIPLLPIQKWFFNKNLENINHFNHTFTIRTPTLRMERIRYTMETLCNHHDAFRIRFRKNGNEFIQFYSQNPVEIPIHSMDIGKIESPADVQKNKAKWQSEFDIQYGPTACLAYLHGYQDGSAEIWFEIHHLIVDSVSWRILKQDFETVYNGGHLVQGGSSYQEWSTGLQNYILTDTEIKYWEDTSMKIPSFNEILTAKATSKAASTSAEFTLTQEETQILLREAPEAWDAEINDLLLTALGYALEVITNEQLNYVTLERHGREEFRTDLDVSHTVGWFTSMYPVRIQTSGNLEDSICKIKETLRGIPYHGLGYGLQYGYKKTSLPAVTFNYLGQFDSESTGSMWAFKDLTGERVLDKDEGSSSENVLDVTGACFNGELRFNMDSHFDDTDTKQFTLKFKETLLLIAESKPFFEDHFEPYFEFNNSGNNDKILFVFPPGEGGAESYFNNIVNHLPQYRLILFNNYYLDNKNILRTFEDLAQFYIKYLKRIQANGPYNLLGWSFGGVLSLEISRQLTLAGDKIENIFFIDSYFDVKKAYLDIDRQNETEIIDRINYCYSPSHADLQMIIPSVKNIVLFKAGILNETFRTDDQYLLYQYYLKTDFNNLDSLINPKFIQVFHLRNESHGSWVKNAFIVEKMCKFIGKKIE